MDLEKHGVLRKDVGPRHYIVLSWLTQSAPAFCKDDIPNNRTPGGLMEQTNASLQRGDQG